MRVVRVLWTDAAGERDEAPELVEVTTVGFLVEQDQRSVLVAAERHLQGGTVSYRDFTRIPREIVRDLYEIQ